MSLNLSPNGAPPVSPAVEPVPVRRESPWQQGLHEFLRSKSAVFGLVIFIVLAVAALAAPWITPQNPYDLMQLDVMDARLPPGTANGAATFTYWLGTDGQGRDLLSGIIYGLRISLGSVSARHSSPVFSARFSVW